MKITIKVKDIEVLVDDGVDKTITFSPHNEQLLVLLKEMIKQTKELIQCNS